MDTQEKMLNEISDNSRKALEKVESFETAIEDLRADAKNAKEMKDAVEHLEEQLKTLPAELREDIKNQLDSMPNPEVEEKTKAGEWEDVYDLVQKDAEYLIKNPGNGTPVIMKDQVLRKSFESPSEMREKAVTAQGAIGNSPVPGAATLGGMLWDQAVHSDPWIGAGANQLSLSAPNFKTVELSGISFSAENTAGATTLSGLGGTTAESTHSVQTYVARAGVSRIAEEDMSGTVALMTNRINRLYYQQRGSLTTAAVKAGLQSGNTVASGAAAAFASGEAYDKLISLPTEIPLYRAGANYVVNPDVVTELNVSITGKAGVTFNPMTGIPQIGLYPLNQDTQMDAPNTANNKPAFFGQWNEAVVQAQRGRLIVDQYLQTIPGMIVLYAAFRFIPVVVNNQAFSGINIAAS